MVICSLWVNMKDLRKNFWNLILFASLEASVCKHPYPTHQNRVCLLEDANKMHPLPPNVVQSARTRIPRTHLPCGFTTALTCVYHYFYFKGLPQEKGEFS